MTLVPFDGRMPYASRYPIVGYVLPDGQFLDEACVDDVVHDLDQAQPVRTCDPDHADLVCCECGMSRETAWNEPDPGCAYDDFGLAA